MRPTLFALLVIGCLSLAVTVFAGDNVDQDKAKAAQDGAKLASTPDVLDSSAFEALLKKYVDSKGQVAYAAWHRSSEDRAALKKYVDEIATAKPETKSRHAQLAFYINAYNAVVLNSVLEKWPMESVMKVDGFFNKEKHRIASTSMTLDDLEHNKVIRVQFSEPRIHFVLVCAAKSCPRLRRQALTEANLEATLEASAREFIPAATSHKGDTVHTSQLFNWFKQDFEKQSGSVPAYLARYVDAKTAAALRSGSIKIEFTDYDWGVNKQ